MELHCKKNPWNFLFLGMIYPNNLLLFFNVSRYDNLFQYFTAQDTTGQWDIHLFPYLLMLNIVWGGCHCAIHSFLRK